MATLNIGGKKVKVDDAFLRMSPEQQQATVEEISASLGPSAQQPMPSATQAPAGAVSAPAGLRPGTREYADWAAQSARAGNQLPMVSRSPNSPQAKYDDALERVRRTQFPDFTDEQWERQKQAFAPVNASQQAGMSTTLGFGDEMAGLVAGIGGAARDLTGGGGGGFGPAFRDVQELEQARYNLGKEQNGALGQAAEVVGSLATLAPARNAAGLMASQVIGPTFQAASRVPQLVKTAASSSAGGGIMGYAEGFGRAEGDLAARHEGGKAGGAAGLTIGAVVPLGTAAIGATGRGVYRAASPVVRSALNPLSEASRRVGAAVGRDRAAGNAMTQADELVARQAGVPLTNVDRGGETARALARSVANQNPEARETLTGLAQERYKGQAGRAVDFIKRTFGRVDDLDYQDQLNKAASLTNRTNYNAAMSSPDAQNVFTAELQELMQSPAVQKAISQTKSRGADMAAIAGNMPVKNPFRQGSDGVWRIVQKANGTMEVPNLAFWDQVKRNLDSAIGVAKRSGDNTEVSILAQIKDKLVKSLDDTVGEYAAARAGASAAFGADNAVDAGRKFARAPGQVPEAERSFGAMTAKEKEAFGVGYASELVDRINARGDSQNIIKQMFESPAARKLNETILGKAKAQQLEAYVRVEALADKLRTALGNSTTARQLVELGLGGVGGFSLTGDWQGAIGGAALARGGRYAGEKIDARVMENVAKLLVSGTRADLDRAVANASLSPKWMQALQVLSDNVSQFGGPLAVTGTMN